MRTNFTILTLLFFCIHVSWGQVPESKSIALHNNAIIHNFAMADTDMELEICGLQKGNEYTLSLYDERFDPKLHYDWHIDGKNSEGYFVAQKKCTTLYISKKNKKRGMTYPYLNIRCLDCLLESNAHMPLAPIQVEINNDAVELVKDIFLSSSCFDIIESSINIQGSIGTFSSGSTSIGMEDGIILATGALSIAQGPNLLTGSGGPSFPSAGDNQLGQLAGFPTNDAALIEFDFIPTTDEISFEYVFASEEYCDYTTNPDNGYMSPFNDAFGFFISGPDISGPYMGAENIALVPGTTTPVSINNVNYNSNSQYYVSNVPTNQIQENPGCSNTEIDAPPFAENDIEYDGYTTVLTARRQVTPCETYHLKMVVGDAVDQLFDSAVFLKANSFSAGGKVDIDIAFNETGENHIYENCGDSLGVISFIRQDALAAEEFLSISVLVTGTASNSDYDLSFNQTITIPPLPPPGIHFEQIEVFFDNIPEGIEDLRLELDVPCNCDIPFYEILILDPPPIEITNVPDLEFCNAQPVTITPILDGGLPDVAVENPSPNYIFEWTGPDNFSSSNKSVTFTPPDEPGAYEYYLTVSDDCGNMAMDTAVISVIGATEASISGEGFVCGQGSTTDLEVLLTGPGPWDIVYSINGTEQDPITVTESPFMLPASEEGTYELVSMTSGPCPGEVSGQATVDEPSFVLSPTPQDPLCAGQADGAIAFEATGGNTPYTYTWSNGESTANLNNIPAGNYSVTITDGNGCTAEASTALADPSPITAQATLASGTTCLNADIGAIDLTVDGGSGAYTFAWSDGSTEQNATGLTAGNYDVVVSDENGCTTTANLEVPADDNVPDANASVNQVLSCDNETVTLSGTGSSTGAEFTYEWSSNNGGSINGSNLDFDVEADAVGTYQLLVTNTTNGCSSTAEIEVEQDFATPNPEIVTPQILSCINESIVLDGSPSTGNGTITYEWNTGETSPSITVSDATTYNLIVTNEINGCTESVAVTVGEDTMPPDAVAGNPATLNCTIETLNLDGDGSSTGDNFAYQWTASGEGNISGDATSLTPEIDAPGTYEIVVTNTSNGCTNTASVTIDENIMLPNVEAGASQELSCSVESLTLDGTGSDTGTDISYAWETPNGNILTGDASLSPEVNAPGTYNLIVTNAVNGCSASDMVEITQDLNAPTADAGQPATLDCVQKTYTLDASNSSSGSDISFAWTTTDGNFESGETTLSPTIDQPGTYILTLTNNVNECTAVSSVTIDENIENPEADAGTTFELNCEIESTEIGGTNTSIGDDFSYTWTSTDGSFEGSTNSELATVNAAGTYELLVTNTSNGCTATSSVNIEQDIENPTADAGSADTLTCIVTELTLDGTNSSAGANFEYQWTTADGNLLEGENSINPNIDAPGTYQLLVTNTENQCTAIQTVTIAEEGEFPDVAIATPAILNCTVLNIPLDGTGSSVGDDFNYEWTTSDGNILDGTDSINPTVDEPGTYELQVSNLSNGCNSFLTIEVSQDINLPTADAGTAQELSCVINEVSLSGELSSTGTDYSYEWTAENGNITSGSNSLNPMVDQAGTYTLIVTDDTNNCTATAEVEVTVDANTPIAVAGPSAELNCMVAEVTLDGTASSQTAGLEYSWTTADGNILSGEDALTPTIDQEGTYTLSIFDPSNGCNIESSVVITENTTLPVAMAANPAMLDCITTEINLDATGTDEGMEFSYLWTSTNGNIASGENTINPLIDEPGLYELLVTNTNNECTTTLTLEVMEDIELPTADAGTTQELNCEINELSLNGTATSTGAEFNYEWQFDNGNIVSGDMGSNPVVDQAGIYTLLVTNTNNNCTATSEVEITLDEDLPVAIAGPSAELNCTITELVLDGTASSQTAGLEYTWTTSDGNILSGENDLNPSIDAAGTYTLSIFDPSNNCEAQSSIEISQNILNPTVEAGTSEMLNCTTTELTLDATGTDEGDEYIYQWTTQDGNLVSDDTDLNPTIDAPGLYNLLVTNTTNNCTATDDLIVLQDIENPIVLIDEPSVLTCQLMSTNIVANSSSTGSNFSYQWTTQDGNILSGDDSLNPEIDTPGTYELLITDTNNNCTATASQLIEQDVELPTIAIAEPSILTCEFPTSTLNGLGSSEGDNFDAVWTTMDGNILSGENELNAEADAPGTYTLTVTNNQTGCQDFLEVTIDQNVETPTADAGTDLLITCDEPTALADGNASSVGAEFTYQWITANGNFVGDPNNIDVNINQIGDYTLLVTNTSNGCTAEDVLSVTSNDVIPQASIETPDILDCDTEQIILEGNASNGTNLTYEWTSANGNIIEGSDTSSPTVNAPGEYNLLVTNTENGCAFTTNVSVTQNLEAPNIDAGEGGELTCTTTEIQLNALGSSGDQFTTQWTTADGNITTGDTGFNPTVNQAGTYTLTITNLENACTAEDIVTISLDENVPTDILANVAPPPCFGDPAAILIDGIDGGNGPFEYSLDGVNYSNNPSFTDLEDGQSYTVFIIDANGCELEETLDIPSVPEVTVDIIPQVDIQLGDEYDLETLTNIPMDEIESITWTPSTDLSCDDCLTPTSSATQTTLYEVTVVNENGCQDSAEILLRVDREINVYIPNAFSPFNADGINDKFTVFAREGVITNVKSLNVYDRWGNKVFELKDFPPNDTQFGWDGFYRDREMSPAVFGYWFEVELATGEVEVYKGDVTLIK